MINAVLLDLDNTLYVYKPCHQAGLLAFAQHWQHRELGDAQDAVLHYKLGRDAIHQQIPLAAASHHRLLYAQRAIETKLSKSDCRLAIELDEVYWAAFFAEMRLVDGAYAWLSELNQAKIPIALITDMVASIQFAKLLRLGIAHLISHVVTSEELGVEKPHPKLFWEALRKLDRQASQNILMIGDSLSRDIQPALDLGLSAIWLTAGVEAQASECTVWMAHDFVEIRRHV